MKHSGQLFFYISFERLSLIKEKLIPNVLSSKYLQFKILCCLKCEKQRSFTFSTRQKKRNEKYIQIYNNFENTTLEMKCEAVKKYASSMAL